MFVLLIIVVLIVVLVFFASMKPSAFHIERAISVNAPAEKIFPMINDFHKWSAWSPYEKLDPNMKRTFSGPSSGPGSVYAWEGNSKAGSGSITITDVEAPSRVSLDLDMLKPMEGHNKVVFNIAQQSDVSRVTWGMDGHYAFMAKVMGVFMNMDKMIGDQFAEGLENLKRQAEAS